MDGFAVARAGESVFGASRGEAWMRWRARKLDARPMGAAELLVEVRDPLALSRAERSALAARCRRANMAIYACARSGEDPSIATRIALQLGLGAPLPAHTASMDAIARVPWHTAGHGNPAGSTVRASVIHCAGAGGGGDFALLDPELAWLMLRDQGEAFARTLAQRDAFSIPQRRESHAVFTAGAHGDLHMRFSEARDAQRWKCDATVSEAAARLRRILDRDDACVVRARLEAGMGIVGNNVLVTRSMLLDTATRTVCSAFRERVPGTEGAWRALAG